MNIFTTDPPPPTRERVFRLTDELKQIQRGQSVVLDSETAYCLASFIRYHGGTVRRKKLPNGRLKIWSV